MFFGALRDISHTIGSSKSFIEKEPCSTDIVNDLGDPSPAVQRDALKKILCMLQRGKDCSEYHLSVLRVCSTADPQLRRMLNYYFRRVHLIAQNLPVLRRSGGAAGDQPVGDAGAASSERFGVIPEAPGSLAFASPGHRKRAGVLSGCRNSIMSDLSSGSNDLRNSAIECLVELADVGTLPPFLRKLRTILRSGTDENKARGILLLEKLLEECPRLLEEFELISEVLDIIKLGSFHLQVCAIKCVNRCIASFAGKKTLMSFLEKAIAAHGHEIYYCGMGTIMRKLLENREMFAEDDMSWLLEKLKSVLSTTLSAALYAAQTIVAVRPELSSYVFGEMCKFLCHRNEDLFHLLTFLLGVIQAATGVEYENRLFAVYGDDTVYNKRAKLKILSQRPDRFSIEEILNLSLTPGFEHDALDFCMRRNIANTRLFSTCLAADRERTERLLCYHCPSGEEWRVLVCEHYRSSTWSTEAMFIMSNYFMHVPECPEELLHAGYPGIFRFYVGFYLRNVIGMPQLKVLLGKLGAMDGALMAEAIFLEDFVKREDTKMLEKYFYGRPHHLESSRSYQMTSEHSSAEDRGEGISIEIMKPFAGEKGLRGAVSDVESLANESVSLCRESEPDLPPGAPQKGSGELAPQEPTNDQTGGANRTTEEDERIQKRYEFVDFSLSEKLKEAADTTKTLRRIANTHFTGLALLKGRSVFLRVISMSSSFKISTKGLAEDREAEIAGSGEHVLGSVSVPQPMHLRINDLHGYTVNLCCRTCIEPFACEMVVFNDFSNRIDDYVVLSKAFILKANMHVINRQHFAFKMLGNLFFGRISGNGVVVKGTDKGLLVAMAKEFS